jgi:nucleoside 2-deoxyribosyltransferase
MHDVYIAGALTNSRNPEGRKKFYEAIARACEEAGLEAYLPHMFTDPVDHPDISPQEVYLRDFAMVSGASLLIACVDEPSLGVGTELEIAKCAGVKIVLLYRSDGSPPGRMVRGNPAVVKEIAFESEEDAIRQLREFLASGGRHSRAR